MDCDFTLGKPHFGNSLRKYSHFTSRFEFVRATFRQLFTQKAMELERSVRIECVRLLEQFAQIICRVFGTVGAYRVQKYAIRIKN